MRRLNKRWHSYVDATDYKVTKNPGYVPDIATNPFRVFQEISDNARHHFLLYHAQNTIMAFIKDPVCRGRIAVNVIHDYLFGMTMAITKMPH